MCINILHINHNHTCVLISILLVQDNNQMSLLPHPFVQEADNITKAMEKLLGTECNPIDLFHLKLLMHGRFSDQFAQDINHACLAHIRNNFATRMVCVNAPKKMRDGAPPLTRGRRKQLLEKNEMETTAVQEPNTTTFVSIFSISISTNSPPAFQCFPLATFVDFEYENEKVCELLFQPPKVSGCTLPEKMCLFPSHLDYVRYENQEFGHKSNPFQCENCLVGNREHGNDIRIKVDQIIWVKNAVLMFLFSEDVVNLKEAGIQVKVCK